MELGGPVWHASVGGVYAPRVRRRLALEALKGVGLPGMQWEHDRPMAYHIRRRLTPDEQKVAGDVIDLRGTSEATQRLERVRSVLPWPALELAVEELGL